MKSKAFLKLMLVLTVLLGAQTGLLTPDSALAAPCCQSCDPDYLSCASYCDFTCAGNQSCLSSCYQSCDAENIRCMRSCTWCSGSGGGSSCCYYTNGYGPASCSSCVTC